MFLPVLKCASRKRKLQRALLGAIGADFFKDDVMQVGTLRAMKPCLLMSVQRLYTFPVIQILIASLLYYCVQDSESVPVHDPLP